MNVRHGGRLEACRTVTFDAHANQVHLIEQRLLPHQFEILKTSDFRSTALAIRDMVVRGAGAIGATAAFGYAQGLLAFPGDDLGAFASHSAEVFQVLKEARPTAVDPVNAMLGVIRDVQAGRTVAEKKQLAVEAAQRFADEDVDHCREIGLHGVDLIQEGARVLTHCNAGWLAFVDIGSATAPLYAAHARGRRFHVFCDETRPRCQGASLTAWELAQEGISHQVIADNAAGFLMWRQEIDLVIVGSDRVLGRTGEVANKIGTYTKAVLAHRHGIPFYVAIPLSTIDWEMASGRDIPIEERDGAEVCGAWGMDAEGKRSYVRIANPGTTARNPGFDVTPPELITGIITPKGIFKPSDLLANRGVLGGEGR